ncbi:MAG: hypothetical protein CMM01_03375 [Rhodopirellula sp.]|nr:hypothetical protein [Rhodopirellula sp.]
MKANAPAGLVSHHAVFGQRNRTTQWANENEMKHENWELRSQSPESPTPETNKANSPHPIATNGRRYHDTQLSAGLQYCSNNLEKTMKPAG